MMSILEQIFTEARVSWLPAVSTGRYGGKNAKRYGLRSLIFSSGTMI